MNKSLNIKKLALLSIALLLIPFFAVAQTSLGTPGMYTRYISSAGSYTFALKGGDGSGADGTAGTAGQGAIITGTFNLVVGDQLTIIVGALGSTYGGGGGSAIILNSTTLLLVAGGGGSFSYSSNYGIIPGSGTTALATSPGSTSGSGDNSSAGQGGGYGVNGGGNPCSANIGGRAGSLTQLSAGGSPTSYINNFSQQNTCLTATVGYGGSGFGGGGGGASYKYLSSNGVSGGGGGGYAGGGPSTGGGPSSGGLSYAAASASNVSVVGGGAVPLPTLPANGSFNTVTTLSTSAIFITSVTVTGNTFNPGAALNVSYAATGFTTGNVFTAQLSDASGSFTTPVTIGTLNATANGTISATLPSVIAYGTGYRIRVISSLPASNGPDNGLNLTINGAAITTTAVSGSPFSAGNSVSVPFTTTGNFGSGNSFTAQLSDAAGSFTTPVTIGTGSASPIAATIPTPVGSGTAYRIRVVASNPAVTGTDNGSNLVISGSTITTSALAASTYTAGVTVSVPFTISGTYSAGNVFTAQLSNASGSFGAPVSIGSLTGTTAGTVSATIPSSTTAGNAYRIRVVSSSPAAIGTDNGSNIAVTGSPNALAFDGSDVVNMPNTVGVNNFATGLKFTLECWVNPAINTTGTFINKGGGGGNEQYSLDISSSILRFYVKSASGGYTIASPATTVLPLGVWTHIAATFDASKSIMVLYVNGASQSSKIPPSDLNSNTASLSLGAQAGATQPYTGRMDEVRIWNRALCQAEIQANMNKELAPGQNGLVAYYKMNQGTAGGANTGITTLTDVSGSGSNGTLAGFDLTNGNTISNWVAGSNQITGTATTPFVETTTGITQTMSGTNPATFTTTCSDFAKLIPSGGAATQVTGSVTAIQRMDASVQSANGVAYVQRHYDLLATTNPTTATANVTLYFTQAEFDAYNAANGTAADLPVSSSDNTGKGNLRVTQFHGTPTGGYAPANYPATWGGSGPAHVTIIPGAANVVWNSTAARWEVTFPITGFSGFFVSGVGSSPLPVKLLSFTATNVGTRNRIDWSTATEDEGGSFEITRSSNGSSFGQIGEAAGKGHDASYTFYDNQPINGVNYYRLKSTEASGEVTYSNIAIIRNEYSKGSVTVAPVPAKDLVDITNTNAALEGITAVVMDMQGREVYRLHLSATNSVDIAAWPAGIYSLRLADGTTIRLVKQ